MDVGVGSFILTNSLSAENHLRKTSVFASLKSSIPILILGLIRLFTVKSVEYQV